MLSAFSFRAEISTIVDTKETVGGTVSGFSTGSSGPASSFSRLRKRWVRAYGGSRSPPRRTLPTRSHRLRCEVRCDERRGAHRRCEEKCAPLLRRFEQGPIDRRSRKLPVTFMANTSSNTDGCRWPMGFSVPMMPVFPTDVNLSIAFVDFAASRSRPSPSFMFNDQPQAFLIHLDANGIIQLLPDRATVRASATTWAPSPDQGGGIADRLGTPVARCKVSLEPSGHVPIVHLPAREVGRTLSPS